MGMIKSVDKKIDLPNKPIVIQKMTTEDCQICCEAFNRSTHTAVECIKCSFKACRTCTRKYLLSKPSEAHCMSCKDVWSREFLVDNLCRSFVYGEWKRYKEGLLLETEKARLVDDVENAAQVKQRDALRQRKAEIRKQIRKLQEQHRGVEGKLWEVQRIMRGEEIVKKKPREFVHKCPADNCNGFLSNSWKCKICELVVCPKCHEIKENPAEGGGAPHNCKQENIDTVKFLKRDTKKCPKCATRIHKINGCDQMWCTQCHIAFKWSTGDIVTNGIIHNPHFVAWQKELAKQGKMGPARAVGDVPCGGIPYHYQFYNAVVKRFAPKHVYRVRRPVGRDRNGNDLWAQLMDLHRNGIHLQHVVVRNMRQEVQNIDNNRDVRIQFLLGQIDEKKLSSMVIRRALTKEKKTAMLHIYELVNTIITENIREIWQAREVEIEKHREMCLQCIKNCHRIRIYANEELKKVSVTYGQSVELFDKDFETSGKKYCKKTLKAEISKKEEISKNTGHSLAVVELILDSLETYI